MTYLHSLSRLLKSAFVLVACAQLAAAVEPVVNDFSVKQRPGTKLVDVDYTVTGDQEMAIGLAVTNNENGQAVPVRTLRGATIVQSGTHRLVWDAGADWDGQVSDDLKFALRVSYDVARYLVIDLAGGVDAEQFPWAEGPIENPSADPAYKTTKLLLRRVPAGVFVMGSPPDEPAHDEDSETQHQVTLTRDFYVGAYEVTQKQWELVMGTNPSRNAGEDHPVEQVDWNMIRGGTSPLAPPAVATFMGVLRAKTGLPLDLPTDAQWEYACRAGTTTAYNNGTPCQTSGGEPDSNLDPIAWYKYTADGGHHTVGTKAPNAWGLYDMHGNVYEWVLDYDFPYDDTPVVDPLSAHNPDYPRPIHRGGGFTGRPRHCRAAYKMSTPPTVASYTFGFRAACSIFNTAE